MKTILKVYATREKAMYEFHRLVRLAVKANPNVLVNLSGMSVQSEDFKVIFNSYDDCDKFKGTELHSYWIDDSIEDSKQLDVTLKSRVR